MSDEPNDADDLYRSGPLASMKSIARLGIALVLIAFLFKYAVGLCHIAHDLWSEYVGH
jgi:succinate dehydrogenase/fumarate reductase cytochrome b subunit